MQIIGLTGGIGSGKSAASAMFGSLGVAVIDTDNIARQLTQPGGAANQAIGEAFGPAMLGAHGELRRDQMRDLAFGDATARKRLEAILHPLIQRQSEAALAALDTTLPYAILAIPLLFESRHRRPNIRRTVTIDCTVATQIARVVNRSRLGVAQIREIINAQVPRAVRLQLADDVIHNEGDLDALQRQVASLHSAYLHCLAGGAACI